VELSVRLSAKKTKNIVKELQDQLIPVCHLILRTPVSRFVHRRATQKTKSTAKEISILKPVAKMKVGANVLIPLLFVKITVQSNVLQKNRHASWDMMTMVVLSQNNAPLEVYALKSKPSKDDERFLQQKNDLKIDKIPIVISIHHDQHFT